ncbi:MAG: hypothetical protein ACF8CQ_24915 [Rhodopirellula sp. JB044]|uniref:hypothetical protein n=1 Tax=Rhodopirellula sp. JB044 TaxID=3342844 RepID=UPI00370C4D23
MSDNSNDLEKAQPSDEEASPDPTGEATTGDQDEGPGCFPAVVAGTLLMGMVAAILCGVTTWILFNKRAEIAVRTLEGFVPMIEQSLLEPEDKEKVIDQFESLIKEMSAPDYPPAAASAVMQRLVRLPIPHWGELDAVQSYIEKNYEGDEKETGLTQLSRVRKAVQMSQATVFDVVDVLEPVVVIDNATGSRSLKSNMTREQVDDVIDRARLLAERCGIEDKRFPRVDMSTILRQEIKAAKTEGGF